METEERSRARFEIELEFVQALAAPEYVHGLAMNGYLDDERFHRYLKYLRKTWTLSASYSKFILYPACHIMLELLQNDSFRNRAKEPGFVAFARAQLESVWYAASDPLMKEGDDEGDDAGAAASSSSASSSIGKEGAKEEQPAGEKPSN